MKTFTVEWVELLKETRVATFKAQNKAEVISAVKNFLVTGDSKESYIEFDKIKPGSIKIIQEIK